MGKLKQNDSVFYKLMNHSHRAGLDFSRLAKSNIPSMRPIVVCAFI